METYIIGFFLLIIGLIGVYIYSIKRLREKVNLKQVWELFWIVMILKVFDIISTVYFTNKIGIEYEGNQIARDFMFQFGIIPGLLLASLLIMPVVFFWFVSVNYLFYRWNAAPWGWKFFKGIMIAIFIITISINFTI